MGLLDKIFKKEKRDDDILQFYRLGGDERMRRIMEWGDKGDNSKLKLIQHVILNDTDPEVKMAALKRIHLFEDKENIRRFLSDAKTKKIGERCEPYYSMALSRTGLITIEEFEKRIGS
jgi:hypothetical protein